MCRQAHRVTASHACPHLRSSARRATWTAIATGYTPRILNLLEEVPRGLGDIRSPGIVRAVALVILLGWALARSGLVAADLYVAGVLILSSGVSA